MLLFDKYKTNHILYLGKLYTQKIPNFTLIKVEFGILLNIYQFNFSIRIEKIGLA